MHPVIKHILSRKNQKVPIKDGRKTALVLFGGAMAAIRGAGVCLALQQMGLAYAFDDIYCASAGFCNASYMLSGNGPEGLSIFYKNIAGKKFINFLKIWRVLNIKYLIHCIEHVQPLRVKKILNLKTKVHVRVGDSKTGHENFMEVHDFTGKSYFDLMRAAISIPYLSPGAVPLGERSYRDLPSNDTLVSILLEVMVSGATDILIVYNYHSQYEYVHSKVGSALNSNRIFEIVPEKSWKMSRFETRSKVLKSECVKMGNLTNNIFGNEKSVNLKYKKPKIK